MVRVTLNFTLQLIKKKKKNMIFTMSFLEPGIPMPYSENFQSIE